MINSDRHQRGAGALFDEALKCGALAFAEPLLAASVSPEPSEMPDRVRSEHGASYELGVKLGRGGMAAVFLARDARHDRRVAIKVLHADLTERLGAQRFVQEIHFAARLQHPHVLGLLDSGVFDNEAGSLAGRPYFAMPYVDGETLRARLIREGALPIPEAVRLLREVADALCYAHEQGVVHRDIKPENILLSHGHAVVADFGIAKALAAAEARPTDSPGWTHTWVALSPTVTHPSTMLGTPAYMAPEQAAARAQVDHRADLYAWGVVAYEVLSGTHPFNGRASAHELIGAHRGEMPRALDDVAEGVPPVLDALVMRCLAKAPSDRPACAAEIVATLDTETATGTAEHVSPIAVAERPRFPILVALGMLVLLGVVGTRDYWRTARGESHQRAATTGSDARQQAAPTALPRTVVVGTGNPAIDVPAVQAAVDQGGDVVLEGAFSFRRQPTRRVASTLAAMRLPYPASAEVLVSRAVSISGVRDARGGATTIESGTIPFYVEAPRARVVIQGLRFVRPIANAILVHAVQSLEIASNRIDTLEPFAGASEGIGINTTGLVPTPLSTGSPENVFGTVVIRDNEINAAGGNAGDYTSGITVFSVGKSPGAEVDMDIANNRIRNTSGSAINVRRVNGRVRVVANVLRTSTGVGREGAEVVRLANSGFFLMMNNEIECRWANGVAIALFSQHAQWPLERAVVENNDVLMSPPPGSLPGDLREAIVIRGFANGNIVRHNTIRGRARVALSMYAFQGGVPDDNAFIDNRVDQFKGSLADVFVGPGILKSRIVGPGAVVDQGKGIVSGKRSAERRRPPAGLLLQAKP